MVVRLISVGSPIISFGSPIIFAGSPIISVGSPIIFAGSPIISVGSRIISFDSPIISVDPELDHVFSCNNNLNYLGCREANVSARGRRMDLLNSICPSRRN